MAATADTLIDAVAEAMQFSGDLCVEVFYQAILDYHEMNNLEVDVALWRELFCGALVDWDCC